MSEFEIFAVKNSKTGLFINSLSRAWSELFKEGGVPRFFAKRGHTITWIKLADMPVGVSRGDLIVVSFVAKESVESA